MGGERFVVPLIMHSLVESCLCPDWGSYLQPSHVGTTPEATGQGLYVFLL